MIFDDNLEMSERREYDQNVQKDEKQVLQQHAGRDRLNPDSMKEQKI